jgi:hypothetical protein
MLNIFIHKKETKRCKKDTKDIHKKIFNFHLISFGKLGDKMRPNRYLGMIEQNSSTMRPKKDFFLNVFSV